MLSASWRFDSRNGNVCSMPPIAVATPVMAPRKSGWPRPVIEPSSDSASARPMLMPAPSEAASPTKNALDGLPLSPAAANKGASVDTAPSISPSSAGCTFCSTKLFCAFAIVANPEVRRASRPATGRVARPALVRNRQPLDAAHQQKNDEDQQDQPEAARRIVAPPARIRPSRQRAEQQDDDDDEEYEPHGCLLGSARFPTRLRKPLFRGPATSAHRCSASKKERPGKARPKWEEFQEAGGSDELNSPARP